MSSIDVSGAREALDALAGVDLDVCDRPDLDTVLAQWRRVRAFCDTVEVRIARRAKQLAADGRSEPPEGVLAAKGRRSAREARAVAAREAACEQMPGFEAALARGHRVGRARRRLGRGDPRPR